MDIEAHEEAFLRSMEFKDWIVANKVALVIELHKAEFWDLLWKDVPTTRLSENLVLIQPAGAVPAPAQFKCSKPQNPSDHRPAAQPATPADGSKTFTCKLCGSTRIVTLPAECHLGRARYWRCDVKPVVVCFMISTSPTFASIRRLTMLTMFPLALSESLSPW